MNDNESLLIDKVLDNLKNQIIGIKTAKYLILNLLGKGNGFNNEQIMKISKMLSSVSKEAYLAAGGNEADYKLWYKTRNKQYTNNINN